jgi:phenylpropionate dioxygenase-like ring-hydroxylating dioxygenase large terminal subunit
MEQTLHRDYYFSPDIFQQEQEHIFWREWFCAGRQEELAEPGDYVVVEIAGKASS